MPDNPHDRACSGCGNTDPGAYTPGCTCEPSEYQKAVLRGDYSAALLLQPEDDPPRLTDDQILSGLWWNDPEYPEWCGLLWREYVEKKHAWNDYRRGVATVLRGAMEASDAK